jgi:hypothetical protein
MTFNLSILQIVMLVVPLSGSFHPLLQRHPWGIAQLGLCSANVIDAALCQKLHPATCEGSVFPFDAWYDGKDICSQVGKPEGNTFPRQLLA